MSFYQGRNSGKQCYPIVNVTLRTKLLWNLISKFSWKNFFKEMHLAVSFVNCSGLNVLTHWGRVTHICVSELTIIGSDNGLSPGRHQAIIWNNAGLLSIEPLGTNFSEISFGIQTFSFTKMHLKMSSAKWRPFCLGPNVLMLCRKDDCLFLTWNSSTGRMASWYWQYIKIKSIHVFSP